MRINVQQVIVQIDMRFTERRRMRRSLGVDPQTTVRDYEIHLHEFAAKPSDDNSQDCLEIDSDVQESTLNSYIPELPMLPSHPKTFSDGTPVFTSEHVQPSTRRKGKKNLSGLLSVIPEDGNAIDDTQRTSPEEGDADDDTRWTSYLPADFYKILGKSSRFESEQRERQAIRDVYASADATIQSQGLHHIVSGPENSYNPGYHGQYPHVPAVASQTPHTAYFKEALPTFTEFGTGPSHDFPTGGGKFQYNDMAMHPRVEQGMGDEYVEHMSVSSIPQNRFDFGPYPSTSNEGSSAIGPQYDFSTMYPLPDQHMQDPQMVFNTGFNANYLSLFAPMDLDATPTGNILRNTPHRERHFEEGDLEEHEASVMGI